MRKKLKSINHRKLFFLVSTWSYLLFCPTSFGDDPGMDFSRPPSEDGGPTEIRCLVGILDVDEIDDAGQNFTVNIFTMFRWFDSREAHDGEGNINKPLADVWYPNLIFMNRQKVWSSLGNFVEVSPEGIVTLRKQFWGDFSQPLNLHDFPFDEQKFGIQLIYAGSDSAKEMKLIADPDADCFVTDNYSVADWEILGSEVNTDPWLVRTAEVPSFTLSFTAKRLSNHYLIKVVAPMLMIILLSWVVFWLNPSEGGSQLGVAVTSFLTVIAYHVALSARLPEISYLTRLDVFVFWGTVLVFLAMIEVVITTGLAQKDKVRAARWLDRVCRLVFPALLTVGVFHAFVWH